MKRCLALAVLCFAAVANSYCLDRNAFTITDYHLNVMIDRGTHVMTVDGKLTLRNDSKSPQKNLALQISSSLEWDRIALKGGPLEYLAQPYTSDIDHTGSLSEAIITLPTAVLPSQTIDLEIRYGGTVTADAMRLTRMGAPPEVALRNDWDQISETFTAVRGLGYVVWYPVEIEAVSMSDGTAVSDAIAEWKNRHRNSRFEAKLSVEMGATAGVSVVTNVPGSGLGEKESLPKPRDAGGESAIFITNTLALDSMRTLAPAFAIGSFERIERPTVEVLFTPEHALIAKDYAAGGEAGEPLLDEWLPALSTQPIRIIELSDKDASPYQDGATLFVPLRSSTQQNVQLLLLPTQVAARFTGRPWMQNGLGLFLQAIFNRTQGGRDAALKFLDQYTSPLAQAEALAHPDRGKSANESDNTLLNTTDELYLRVKGGFVFWMLDDMLGDQALQHALASYRAEADKTPTYFQKLLEKQTHRDLEWFFDDWVYRDRGLPDFRVESAFSRKLLSGEAKQYQVTATIENRGGAGAEVPVSFQTANGEKKLRVLVRAHDKAFARVELPEIPQRVIVNDGSVPESDSSNNVYEFATKPQP
jgi:hypothetical protein